MMIHKVLTGYNVYWSSQRKQDVINRLYQTDVRVKMEAILLIIHLLRNNGAPVRLSTLSVSDVPEMY
jgi:hypothetical protein